MSPLLILLVCVGFANAATNVAKGKEVSQSSIFSVTNPASYAVDGNTDSTFRIGGHCAKSGYENEPSLVIDLGDSYTINAIELWTREKDGSVYDAMDSDLEIRVGDSPYHPNNPVCTTFNGAVGRKVEAACGAALCGRYVSVQRMSSGMAYMHICELMALSDDGKAGCVPESKYTAECSCSGDPHCNSFDGKWLHFQGACHYTLARDNCADGVPSGEPDWMVTANFDREGSDVSYVRQVTITLKVHDLIIELFQDRVVHVNGQVLMGSPKTYDDTVTVSVTPNHVYIAQEGGIRVMWDGSAVVKVEMQENMKGKSCGLCGNFNGNPDDDWTVGPGMCMEKYPGVDVGDVTKDTNTMGTSWTSAVDDGEAACGQECPVVPPNPTGCAAGDTAKAEEHCKPLKDPQGPFKECLAKMDEFQSKDLFDNCVYDSCHLKDYENVICEHAASMNMICNAMYSVEVTWRSDKVCPIDCGENMEYQACGEPCVPSCSDLEGEECGDLGACTEGCFCKEGFVFDNQGKCIKPEQCGCLVPNQGIYIPVGESFLTEDCGKHCVCEKPQSTLTCTEKECPENQVCDIVDGVRGCYCLPPFIKVEGECVELPNPCEDGPDTLDLQCLTCKNAKSEEECTKNGVMETCAGTDPICQLSVTKSANQQIKKVERTCATRKSCSNDAISPSALACKDVSGKIECTNCGFGPMETPMDDNPIYNCKKEPVVTVDVCTLNKDTGEGSSSVNRWFFNLAKCKCLKFSYKGAGGNENNFPTKQACEAKCTVFDTPADCLLDKDPGPCDKFKKWYYFNVKAQKCKKFNYGGCEGNANLFKKKDDCRTKCKRC